MKPSEIKEILHLSRQVRKNGKRFIPCFSGDPGVGKSWQAQDYVNDIRNTEDSSFGFIDLRLALREGPDLTGKPVVVERGGVMRTVAGLPGFWPSDPKSSGLLLLEEPNRANTWVTNCIMQLLTDRKMDVGDTEPYILPDGWEMAACINEGSAVDVSTMDAALRNRFTMFNVKYDKKEHIGHLEETKAHPSVIGFVKGAFQFLPADEIKEDGTYVSPRTLEVVSNLEHAGLQKNQRMHAMVVENALGKYVGCAYHKFCYEESPLTWDEFTSNKKAAFKRLSKFTNKEEFRTDIVELTVQNVLDSLKGQKSTEKDRKIIYEIAREIGLDQGLQMIQRFFQQDGDKDLMLTATLTKEDPDLVTLMKKKLGGTESVRSK